jgi:hypothetical protein
VFFFGGGGELEGKIGRVDLAINLHADVPPLIHESSLLAAAFEGPVERPILESWDNLESHKAKTYIPIRVLHLRNVFSHSSVGFGSAN